MAKAMARATTAKDMGRDTENKIITHRMGAKAKEKDTTARERDVTSKAKEKGTRVKEQKQYFTGNATTAAT